MYRYVCGRAVRTALKFIAILFVVGCGNAVDQATLPTPNGRLSSVTSEFPPVGMVQIPGSGGICTGTIIGPNVVLTAAHCVDDDGEYVYSTSFGNFATSTKVSFGAGDVNDPNDIALLIFDTNIADRAKGQVYRIGNSARTGDTVRLVGYGCNNVVSRTGAGVKRTGTNVIFRLTDWMEFASPIGSGSGSAVRQIGGPQNVAYSCFGDSGGPALSGSGSSMAVVGVTHAGGRSGSYQISEYSDIVNRNDNRNWLAQMSRQYGLDIQGL